MSKIRRYLPGLVILVFLILLVVAFFYKWSWINIRPGERGVLWNRLGEGTAIDKVFLEGVTIIWPWNRMYIYNIRVQQIPHEMEALTKEGLKVHFSISIRYHPEMDMLGLLHQRVGPDYADKVIVPEVDGVIRTLIASTPLDQVYGSDTDHLQGIVADAISQIEQNFIQVDAVVIREVRLPSSVEAAIEEKMTQKQLAEAYVYRIQREEREAERKEIEAKGVKTANDIVSTSLNDKLLTWRWIEAAQNLATSANAKTIVLGTQNSNVPIIIGGSGAR